MPSSPAQGLNVGIAVAPLIGFLESIAIAKAFGELSWAHTFPWGGELVLVCVCVCVCMRVCKGVFDVASLSCVVGVSCDLLTVVSQPTS